MLQKSSMFKTMEFFFLSPSKEHYLMDISRKIKLAHTSLKKNLKELVQVGIIVERMERKGKRVFPTYRANTGEKSFNRYKKMYNLSALLESGLIDFIEKKRMPKSIVLFGSYARGEDRENSDIDMFIECPPEKIDLHLFEAKLSRKIQVHYKENFTSYPPELKNNIINGLVLAGFLEGYK